MLKFGSYALWDKAILEVTSKGRVVVSTEELRPSTEAVRAILLDRWRVAVTLGAWSGQSGAWQVRVETMLTGKKRR